MKDIMQEILNDPLWAAITIFVSQITFIYLRTLNVIYTAERRMLPAIITGNGIGLSWLVSMSIGANSVMEGQPIPILLFLLGGTLGTYLGIKQDQKQKKR